MIGRMIQQPKPDAQMLFPARRKIKIRKNPKRILNCDIASAMLNPPRTNVHAQRTYKA